MSNKTCTICSIEFVDEYSYHGHLQGQKHLKRAEFINNKKDLEDRSIFVSPLPKTANLKIITEFFSKYGDIQNCRFGGKYAMIEFKNKSTADELLANPVFLDNWKLNIKKRVIDVQILPIRKNKQKKDDNETSKVNLNEIDNLKLELEKESSFDKQVDKFMSLVQPNEIDLKLRIDAVCNSIMKILKSTFPHGESVPFGSSTTGLALIGSDLDVFYDINQPIYNDDDEQFKIRYENGERNLWTPKLIFREVKSLLYKHRTAYQTIVPIPQAKIPVIKFHHVSTNTDVDLSFKDGLGSCNSKMIKFFLTLDKRIKPLIVIIKYWAKKLELTGSGRITNYSIVMMILFYLQQNNISLIPTIKALQINCPPVIYKNWLVSFDSNFKINNDNCTKNIPQLLCGFFKFYSEFNFATKIICPYDGISLLRNDFKKLHDSNKNVNYELLRLDTVACLQDPIQLNFNIIGSWTPKILQTFVTACNEASKMFDAINNETDNLLISLFDLSLDESRKKKCGNNKKIKTSIFNIHPREFAKVGLPDDFYTRNDIDDKDKFICDNWFELINKLVIKIMEKVFMFDIQMVYDATNGMKQIKIQENTDVHTSAHNKIIFTCTSNYCLSLSRKGRIQDINSNLSCLEREILISQSILEELKEKNEENQVKFTCCIEKNIDPLFALVTMTDHHTTNKSFNAISGILKGKIPFIIDKELKNMQQNKRKPEKITNDC
ncbi:speckle targeted PIP5K1A-regulated poly(A) polymerase-like [Aphidius gifuensis]|uniref:speckle targeted PIP5K1A-regulated poly(A) polymerase-like n=1 Tax=Aphidius gifuensis TaxID=684658 RepID=UPI001CDBDDF9|nr:speckle targeted PIP5K1A-regulated poly(A) polymerase-like [Aphidius gifuensis]